MPLGDSYWRLIFWAESSQPSPEDEKPQLTPSQEDRVATLMSSPAENNNPQQNGVTFYPSVTSVPKNYEQHIIFGMGVESSDTSPTLPPSATSTVYTHPTPLSDASPSQSQAMYHSFDDHKPTFGELPPNIMQGGSQGPSLAPAAELVTLSGNDIPSPVGILHSGHAHGHGSSVTGSENSSGLPAGSIYGRYMPGPGSSPAGDLQPLSTYIQKQIFNSDFANCVIEFYDSNHVAVVSYPSHTLLLARSPFLKHLIMTQSNFDQVTGKQYLHLLADQPFVTVDSLVIAVRACYADLTSMALQPEVLGYHIHYDDPDNVQRGLALIAAGRMLGLTGVSNAGVQLAINALSVKTLEMALSFAFHGLNNMEDEYAITYMDLRGGTHPAYNSAIFQASLQVISANLPLDFVLDTSAPSNEQLGGIPWTKDNESVLYGKPTNPQLTTLQFGSFPTKSDEITTTLSTVFVSVHWSILRHMLEHLGRLDLATDIIQEREKRRKQYVNRNGYVLRRAIEWAETVEGSGSNLKMMRMKLPE